MGRERRRRPGTQRQQGVRALAIAALLAGVLWVGVRSEASVPAPSAASTEELQLERPTSALAAARRAAAASDPAVAVWLLDETARRHPIIGDHARRMQADQLLAMEQPAAAAAVLEQALVDFADSPLAPEFSAALGHARAATGNEFGARAAWRRALDVAQDGSLRASLLAATARSQERSGDDRAATETWGLLWRLHPVTAEAKQAAKRLDRLEPEFGIERDANAWRRRGDKLFRRRRNELALEAYERALADGLSASEAANVKRKRAQTLFRMRVYPRAVEAFADLRQTDDIPIWHARSLARAGRVPEAIAEFERLGSERGSRIALRARFLAALLLDGRGRFDEARKHLESLTRAGGGSSVRRAALWRLAWGAYREARYADAIELLDLLIDVATDPMDGLRSRYWRARCLEGLAAEAPVSSPKTDAARGSADDARALAARRAHAEFSAIAGAYPLSYYGWRARARLPRTASWLPAAAAETPELGTRHASSRALERARILLEAGLDDAALEALAHAGKNLEGLRDQLELAQLYRNAGNFRAAQRLVLNRHRDMLARGPTPTLEDLWWHAWPAAFIDLVRESVEAEESVEPALVLSIMREESGFQPGVISPVGARGLLQIMEPTGERLAAAVGHPNFTADDLFVPRTNIRLGSHYLGELTEQFGGRLSAAIASYNAGPEAVSGWLRKRPTVEDDEWVESIPYDQTRSYVKRVLRSLQAYRLLY